MRSFTKIGGGHQVSFPCKILNKVIKEAKFKYEKDIVKRNSGNSKELWNIIKIKLGENSAQESAIKKKKIYIYIL